MLGLGAYGNLGTDGVLEVGIELLFQIQFRTVTGQVEKLYLVLSLCNPGFDGLAVVGAQIVQNQKYLAASVPDQGIQKLDEPIGVEGLVNDHPAG